MTSSELPTTRSIPPSSGGVTAAVPGAPSVRSLPAGSWRGEERSGQCVFVDSGTGLQLVLCGRLLAWPGVRLATSGASMVAKGSFSFTESF